MLVNDVDGHKGGISDRGRFLVLRDGGGEGCLCGTNTFVLKGSEWTRK